MTREVVEAIRNENAFVDVKWCRNSLRKHVDDIIVRVCAVVEIGTKSVLPLLGFHNILRSRRVENEPFKLHLSNVPDLWPHFERKITVEFVGVAALDKSYFWIEIWSDFSALDNSIEPVRFVGQRCAEVAIATRIAWRLRSSHMRIHEPVLEEDEARVDPRFD